MRIAVYTSKDVGYACDVVYQNGRQAKVQVYLTNEFFIARKEGTRWTFLKEEPFNVFDGSIHLPNQKRRAFLPLKKKEKKLTRVFRPAKKPWWINPFKGKENEEN
jgi:hypothetical protein